MKKLFAIIVFTLALSSCVKKSNEKININITNNRANMIKVEFRAGDDVCSMAYVPANYTFSNDAYPGEYDVYVANYINGADGPFSYHSHGLFYSEKSITIN